MENLIERLSPRQLTVLEQVAKGMTHAQIATALGVARRTVDYDTTATYDILGVTHCGQPVNRTVALYAATYPERIAPGHLARDMETIAFVRCLAEGMSTRQLARRLVYDELKATNVLTDIHRSLRDPDVKMPARRLVALYVVTYGLPRID